MPCDQLCLCIHPRLPQTLTKNDVIFRRYTLWPYISVVEWNPCAHTGGNTVWDNWQLSGFKMLIKHNLPPSTTTTTLFAIHAEQEEAFDKRTESLKRSPLWWSSITTQAAPLDARVKRVRLGVIASLKALLWLLFPVIAACEVNGASSLLQRCYLHSAHAALCWDGEIRLCNEKYWKPC